MSDGKFRGTIYVMPLSLTKQSRLDSGLSISFLLSNL